MDYIAMPIIDKINVITGGLVFFLTYIFGDHWYLFAAFLLLNVIDYVTGIMKSRLNKKVNSNKGSIGLLKKVGYWIMVLIGFLMGSIFIEVGESIGVDLRVTSLLGWLVLTSLIINEIRSILENFVECGYDVPNFLTKSLEIANKTLDKIDGEDED